MPVRKPFSGGCPACAGLCLCGRRSARRAMEDLPYFVEKVLQKQAAAGYNGGKTGRGRQTGSGTPVKGEFCMNHIQRRDAELPYISDEAVMQQQRVCREILQRLNFADRSDFAGIAAIVKELFGRSEGAMVNPPFYCDYGSHIEVGKNFFANYNCTILDVAKVTIGDNVLFGPNVAVYTAGHPLHPEARATMYEYGVGVTIGDNVWIGGNCVVMPGVHIGEGSVIGAGSVVTRDIPARSVAAGNPCRVIRAITDADRVFYYRDRKFDPEAWADVCRRTGWDPAELDG